MAGQFYFAWVESTETIFGDEHKRMDEEIFGFNIHQGEGDFAALDITIINPRVGFLAPGRKTWAWLAYEHPTEGTKTLFFGRLVALPEDLQGEQVNLAFVARPEDFAAQKLAVAETKKVRPFWDPIWFAPDTRNDPDNVLESRPELWHIDRRTLEVTTSNIVSGEDGTINLTEADVFYDSVRLHYGAAPARNINVIAEVSWEQKATGAVDLSPAIYQAFAAANSGSGGLIKSLTGEGLVNSWPKPGSSFGGGWTVAVGSAVPRYYKSPGIVIVEPGWAVGKVENRGNGLPYEQFVYDSSFQPHGGLFFPTWGIQGTLQLSYSASRKKTEYLNFTLAADIQSVVTEPGDEEVLNLAMSSSEVTEPVDYGGALPIRDQKARSYFTTERGAQSVEYILAVARARLLARARCAFIDVEVPFDDAVRLDITCRKNVSLADARMPGGIVAGKVMEYSLQFDGDTGAATCAITFGATVGKGDAITEVAGTPDYVEEDYVEPAYQVYTGSIILPIPGVIGYEPIEGLPPNDDGIDFFSMDPTLGGKLVKEVTIDNPLPTQQALIPFHGPITTLRPLGEWHQYYLVDAGGNPAAFRPDYEPTKAIAALNDEHATKVNLKMAPLTGGPFQTDYLLNVTSLSIPKLIDLEASAAT